MLFKLFILASPIFVLLQFSLYGKKPLVVFLYTVKFDQMLRKKW